MGTGQDKQELIQLLLAHERGMEALYSQCAAAFPAQAGSFRSFAAEEGRHAAAILDLAAGRGGGHPPIIDDHLVKLAPLRTSLKYLNQEIETARGARMTLLGSLTVALGFERSLMEKRFFEVFQSDAPEFRDLLRILSDGTVEHIRRIEAMREQVSLRKIELTS